MLTEAMRILYEERDIEFQAELVEACIRAVGIYPAATSGWLRRPMPTIKRALEPGALGVNLDRLDLHRQFGI
jgi:hypothetical protein